jgi:hypothetical protein
MLQLPCPSSRGLCWRCPYSPWNCGALWHPG